MNARAERRVDRLVRLYPRPWRDQFPDYACALEEELREHPRGVRRNVFLGAAREWLRELGIVPKVPADSARSGLALLYAALIPFTGLAIGMWSQLHTGLGTRGDGSTPVLHASNLLLAIGTWAILVSLPVSVAALLMDGRRRHGPSTSPGGIRTRPLVRPLVTLIASIGVLTAVGWGADHSGWYSPAAAALPRGGPGHLVTLWVRGIVATITPAWIHPTLFTHMPTGQVIACLAAPVAAVVAAGALFLLITRLPVQGPSRGSVVLALTVFGLMLSSVLASGRWLLVHPGREGTSALQARGDQLAPGHAGWIVFVLLAVLAGAAVVGVHRVLGGDPAPPARPRGGTRRPAPEVGPASTGASVFADAR